MKTFARPAILLLSIIIGVFQGITQEDNAVNTKDFGRSLRWWSEVVSKKPYSWFRSEEGQQMAANILSWQVNGTGWPLMSTVREPFTGDLSKAGPWGNKAALVKATRNELRFLARAYTATKKDRYRDALIGGLNYILDAQLECGGWPQRYPIQMRAYYHYATYNDDVIPDIMIFLDEVMSSPDFKTIGEEMMTQVKTAYKNGLEFILKTQISVDGEPTAWAQQYDEITLKPKAARAFEPVAISGGESATVLQFLMSIKKPSKEVIEAVNAGANWYRQVQINGLELIRTADDARVQANPNAQPLWARYYEIGTNTPIFAGRDGVVRYRLADIEQERRRAYAWYNSNGIAVLKRYKEWLYERKWDDLPPTNTDESKVRNYTLPHPLNLADGRRITTVSDWENQRRPEILHLFEANQHGQTPDSLIDVRYEVLDREVPGMGGKSRRTQVRIHFPGHPDIFPIRLLINVPAEATQPVPTLLHISFTPNVLLFEEEGIDEGPVWDKRLNATIPGREAFKLNDIDPLHYINKGYGIATVYYGDIEPDFDHGGKHGVRALFSGPQTKEPDHWGSIGAWAWGLSRILDYLQTDPAVDEKQVAISGVSRLGKAVLWAGAKDQRFAMVIPIVSGEGGAAISRRNFGETIADLTNPNRYDYWYAPRYADFAFNVDSLPVDGHMLLSLIAPRAVLQIVGYSDTWSDPKGEWIAAQAASPVYELYGLKAMQSESDPKPGDRYLNETGFFMHDAGHTVLPEDYEVITDFMDLHFKKAAK